MWQLSATELLAGYRAREFSPVEALDAVAARIEALNPRLGAFTTLCLDRARSEAAACVVGDPSRPLAGVPFAAKDLFDTEGVRTTYGSRMFLEHVPRHDAAVVAALRAAGAILVGKTQAHEFAWGITSVNVPVGSSHNPWDSARVPGGSSGGSGVALAARMVPLALGSDTGGSIRIPAAFCGVMGLKPTYGRVDTAGLWPLAPSLDHAGPMARTPDDVALALGAAPRRGGDLRGATVVASADVPTDAVAAFEALGARIEGRPLPDGCEAFAVFGAIQTVEALRVHREADLFPARADEYGADVRRRLEHAVATADPDAYAAAIARREELRAELESLLGDGALLVTRVSSVPPPRPDDTATLRGAVLPRTTPHNLAGLPSCAVRAGFDDLGLPVGIQIAAAPGRDDEVLRAAAAFYDATPDVQERWPEP